MGFLEHVAETTSTIFHRHLLLFLDQAFFCFQGCPWLNTSISITDCLPHALKISGEPNSSISSQNISTLFCNTSSFLVPFLTSSWHFKTFLTVSSFSSFGYLFFWCLLSPTCPSVSSVSLCIFLSCYSWPLLSHYIFAPSSWILGSSAPS